MHYTPLQYLSNIKMQDSSYKHVYTSIVENRIYPGMVGKSSEGKEFVYLEP